MAWCHVPGTDCPSAQAAEALDLGLMLAEPGYHTRAFVEWEDWPRASSSPPSARDTSPRPRSGMICAASMPALSRCLRHHPRRISLPALQRGRKARWRRRSPPPLARRRPRHRGMPPRWVFLENVPVTSPSALKPSCESFGAWATRLRRVCSRRQKSARRTSGCASSSWPTPMSLHPGTPATTRREQRLHPQGRGAGAGHHQLVDAEGDGWCEGWAGPELWLGRDAAPMANAGGRPSAGGAQWPTPAAQNWKGSSEASITRADGKSRMDILHYRAEQGFTRPAPAITPDGRRSSPHAPISRPLWASMIASHGRVVSRRILKGRSRRRLNPLFVGWLMGWPIGHALCACSATEFTLWQQHMRGALSQLPMASGPWIWRPTDAGPAPGADDSLFEGLQP
jgi:hypothetical protein